MEKFLIAGLGNPGDEYANTRHNAGFQMLDHLAEKEKLKFESDRHGWVTYHKFKGRTLVLLKPNTFMNLSGKAVSYWLQQEKINPRNLLVITDDIALPFGELRLKGKGSDGGHNGLKDIIRVLNSVEFPRLRVGIGAEFNRGGQSDYVLGPWNEEELPKLPALKEKCLEMVFSFVANELNQTISRFNKKK